MSADLHDSANEAGRHPYNEGLALAPKIVDLIKPLVPKPNGPAAMAFLFLGIGILRKAGVSLRQLQVVVASMYANVKEAEERVAQEER